MFTDNKNYNTLDAFYKKKFNCKVAKISLNAHLPCPNIKKNGKGCIFCSEQRGGEYAGNKNEDLVTQFNKIKEMMSKKWPKAKYIGYFQAGTNTNAKVEILKEMYETILKQKDVIGLNIATRPDAINDEVLSYLAELNKKTYLTIELGLQSIHDNTLKYINRGHDYKCFKNMTKKLREKSINVVVHIINGLPNETKEMMLETVKELNTLDIQGVKIHMLHIVKNTPLAKIYQKNPFHILTKEEYIEIVCLQLELLDKNIVINRITADPKKEELIAPIWLIKKFCVLNDIDKYQKANNSYQGKYSNKV